MEITKREILFSIIIICLASCLGIFINNSIDEHFTKEEMKHKIEELQERIEELENDVDYWQSEYDGIDEELNNTLKEIEQLSYNDGINDLDDFIFELKKDNLLTNELDKFINDYRRYKNEG